MPMNTGRLWWRPSAVETFILSDPLEMKVPTGRNYGKRLIQH